jgi:hypothetical protein
VRHKPEEGILPIAAGQAPRRLQGDGAEEGPAHVSDPCEDLEPGAASPEPAQEIEEEVHDASQLAWIEGIWSTP